MARKRMFTLSVVDSDAFLDMPLSAQSLYFHLNMRADDDGFIGNPKRIQRLVGASEDDLKLLIAKRFVLIFENGVIVIKHWRMHNTLSANRYHETKYIDEKSDLLLKRNGAYSFTSGDSIDDKKQVLIGKRQTKDEQKTNSGLGLGLGLGLDKGLEKPSCPAEPNENDKKKKKSINEEQLIKDFEIIYAIYPKKVGRTVAFQNYKKWVSKEGKNIGGKRYHLTNRQIYKAVQNYVKQQNSAGQDDFQYWKNFDTLMGRQLLDYVVKEESDE